MPLSFTTIGDHEFALRLVPGLPTSTPRARGGEQASPAPLPPRVSGHKQPSVVAGGDALGTYGTQPPEENSHA